MYIIITITGIVITIFLSNFIIPFMLLLIFLPFIQNIQATILYIIIGYYLVVNILLIVSIIFIRITSLFLILYKKRE